MATRKTPQKRPIPIKAPEPILFPTAKPVPEEDIPHAEVRYGSNVTDADERLNPVDVPIAVPHPEMPTQMLAYAPVRQLSTVPSNPGVSVEMRNYIATCIGRTIYKALDTPEAEIITMGQAQFEALCRSILEDDEV